MQIKNASYIISSPSYDKCPKADKPEYAFIGRSNVGKSSLINMLCNRQGLAKTSSTPGKTQMINHFLIESTRKEKAKKEYWNLVDLPGYGYAKVAQKERKTWGKMIEDYIRKRENLVNLFVLIDSRHKPQSIDLDFVQSLGDWEIPFTLIFTKSDKEKPGVVKRNVETFTELLRAHWQFLPQIIVTSATKKLGRDEMLELIQECNLRISEA
ncbi:ribosome biogenesis GTP-binding protein YihA/YsxC [Arachidicoccus soli]|uniref:Probable GTP-binding protein EngB n=1 Tax=Arachidicoccus soli TaxID=2341117 RepID=A0A386HTL1_9BACT|nr:ribosome biogenesis GTP-binding protein YihA/YsxC [Arachidicoccus soli]AYD48821.1 YihA family ribosome biogenesis GTP-binding protein [Arachidicoccus soli]